MSYLGVRKPTNKIVAGGNPLKTVQKVETATNMYPGRLVKKGTNDDDIVVCDATGSGFAWLGYEQTDANYRPADIDTIYAQNDQATVLAGGNFFVVASLATGQSVAKGAKLTSSAAGELSAGTAGTDHIYAIAWESVNATSAAADIVVLSLI